MVLCYNLQRLQRRAWKEKMLCTFSTLVDGRFKCGVSQEYPTLGTRGSRVQRGAFAGCRQ